MDDERRRRLEGAYLAEEAGLRAWIGRRLGPESAEDLAQELFLRALANLDSLEPVRDLAAWLWRSARNAVVDAWRSRARRPASSAPEDFDGFVDGALGSVHDGLEREELLGALAKAIAGLPPAQREVIEAQALDGESFASIAERTGTPPDTLAARKRYALARLRKALADYERED